MEETRHQAFSRARLARQEDRGQTTAVGDAQNTFPVWNATPILALDVYEHAYWLDYGRARGKYIEAFFNNLDWEKVAANHDRALAMQAVAR